jgi:hypothetical protein
MKTNHLKYLILLPALSLFMSSSFAENKAEVLATSSNKIWSEAKKKSEKEFKECGISDISYKGKLQKKTTKYAKSIDKAEAIENKRDQEKAIKKAEKKGKSFESAYIANRVSIEKHLQTNKDKCDKSSWINLTKSIDTAYKKLSDTMLAEYK